MFVHTEHVSGMKGLPVRPSFQHVGGCLVVWEQERKSEKTAVVVIIEFTFCEWKFSITVVVTHWIIICRKISTERGKNQYKLIQVTATSVQLFGRPSMLLLQFTCKYITSPNSWPSRDLIPCRLFNCAHISLSFIHSSPYRFEFDSPHSIHISIRSRVIV